MKAFHVKGQVPVLRKFESFAKFPVLNDLCGTVQRASVAVVWFIVDDVVKEVFKAKIGRETTGIAL